jgi:Protein of unknown function (DUF2630)
LTGQQLGVRRLEWPRLRTRHRLHSTIEKLVAEEHELWGREAAGDASESDRSRLDELKVSLDQCWDLLRQRRALREAGRDPDSASVRPPDVVER